MRDAGPTPTLCFGPFVLDGLGGRLLRNGTPVPLAPKPFAVLSYLAARPGLLVSKNEILDAVWGHRFVSDSVLKVAMNGLRSVLGEDAKAPRWLHTVARRGYRFEGADGPAAATTANLLDPPAEAPPSAATAPGLPRPLGNLPPLTTPMWGRDGDQARLRALLAGQRLVTLVGTGGVGKTRLALAAAGQCAAADFPDGVWLLRLDALTRAAEVPAALARCLGLSLEAGRNVAALARALAPLRALVLLDNAEHLLDGPAVAPQADADTAALGATLAQCLAAAPQLHWLVTSQRPLRLAGEQLLPLAPLPTAPAVALLRARVQALQPGWEPDAAALEDLHAIATGRDGLDGLPLALELAAVRMPLLGTTGVRARLGERLRLLTRGAADAPDRHRTLQAALAWSVGLLPPRTAALLARLSVFAGSFVLDAAQAVAGAEPWSTVDDLDELRERSLLAAADSQRMRLLDSVRAFAAERLEADLGARDAALRARGAWVLAVFTAADARITACSEDRWLVPLLAEAENLQLAMDHALAQAEAGVDTPESAVQLLAACAVFCIRAGLKQAASGWLARLQTLLDAPGAPVLSPPLATRWQMARALLGALGQLLPPAAALAAVEEALQGTQSWHGPADGARRLYLQYHRAMLLTRLGRHDEAATLPAKMQTLLGPAPTRYERRLIDWIEAVLARDRGDLGAYGDFWAAMLAQSQALGDTVEAGRAAWGLGQTLYLQDRLDDACAALDGAVDALRECGRLRAFAVIAAQAAVLRVQRDVSTDTLLRLHEAVLLLQGEDMLWWMADALAWVPLHQGRLAQAAAVQAWADSLVKRRGDGRGPVFAKLREAFARRLGDTAPQPHLVIDSEAGALRLALGWR